MRQYLTKFCLFGALSTALGSCIITSRSFERVNPPKAEIAISPTVGGKLYTSAWIQRSAEYKALCLQAYNIATLHLEEAMAKPLSKGEKSWAIVTDIDETIIDNTPNAVHQALRGEDYTDASWDAWCDRADAEILEGAKEFFQKADRLGVKIFYISNRNEQNRAGTLRNLKALGLPQVNNDQLLLRGKTSDKTERRNQVLAQYNILMLLGDNLGDFEHIFDSANELERKAAVQTYASDFGRRFIVLPNPNYGTWEKAMNQGYPPLQQKDKKLMQTLLKTY